MKETFNFLMDSNISNQNKNSLSIELNEQNYQQYQRNFSVLKRTSISYWLFFENLEFYGFLSYLSFLNQRPEIKDRNVLIAQIPDFLIPNLGNYKIYRDIVGMEEK